MNLKRFSNWKRKIAVVAIVWMIGCSVLAIICTHHVASSSATFLFSDIHQVPINEVGLVLGGGNYMYDGVVNLHFMRRVEAAAELYRAGRVKHLLVTGDDIRKNSREPSQMKMALMALNIPEKDIMMDRFSFRTLDSVLRAKEIFGQSKLTIITEQYHCYRAVYLARFYQIDAVGFAPRDSVRNDSWMGKMREYFSNVKAVLDLYLLKTCPAFSSLVEGSPPCEPYLANSEIW